MAKEYKIQVSGFPLFIASSIKNKSIGSNDIRVSEVWAFLSYTIRISKKPTGNPLNKGEQSFLLDLLEQAKYFFETAEEAPIKSQPLLYYYSFMNLSKIAINLNYYLGNSKRYVHGITDTIMATSKLSNVEISLWKSDNNKYSISEELIKMLGDQSLSYVSVGRNRGHNITFKVIDLLKGCIGIHKTYCEIFNQKDIFYKLSNIELYSKSKKLYIKANVDIIDDASMDSLISKGYNIRKEGVAYILEEDVNIKKISSPTQNEKYRLAKKLKSKGVWTYTDVSAYKLYISDLNINLSSASIIYHVMFFFGSITRYHPDLFDKIMSAKEYWLISEFLRTQPKQFLYYMVSKINGVDVLMSKQI
jgi:hypothetical protein